jgi:hypothetical protein
MLASVPMKIRVILVSGLRVMAIGCGLSACGGPTQGKLTVDTPILHYQKPDISEITGIDEDDEDSGSGSAAGSGSGSAEPGK